MSTIEREKTVPEVRPVTTREVLHRAADLLEEFGWCQDALARDDEGNESEGNLDLAQPNWTSFCAIGAASRAALDLGTKGCLGVTALPFEIIAFNNAPGRTREEVVARIRELADRA